MPAGARVHFQVAFASAAEQVEVDIDRSLRAAPSYDCPRVAAVGRVARERRDLAVTPRRGPTEGAGTSNGRLARREANVQSWRSPGRLFLSNHLVPAENAQLRGAVVPEERHADVFSLALALLGRIDTARAGKIEECLIQDVVLRVEQLHPVLAGAQTRGR